ncbi:MAG: zinc-ribbon domain-containing protein [Candidatus Jordarchaeales archaeon]
MLKEAFLFLSGIFMLVIGLLMTLFVLTTPIGVLFLLIGIICIIIGITSEGAETATGRVKTVPPPVPAKPKVAREKKEEQEKGLPPGYMYCLYCGEKIPKASRFCPNCGAALE